MARSVCRWLAVPITLVVVVSAAAQSTADFGVIVEFRDPPLAELNVNNVRAKLVDYQSTFKRFRADLTSILQAGMTAKTAAASEPQFGHEYHVVFNGVSTIVPRSAVPAIKQLPYVKRVYLDKRVQACGVPGPDVVQVGADRVQSTGNRGRGIVVAILDTGVDYTHPALGGGIGPSFKVIGGYDFVNKKSDPMDDEGHGTGVAGIIASDSDARVGVAPDVSLLAYKVLDSQGLGKESDIIAGLERATDPNGDGDLRDHADIANLSLGGTGGPDDAQSVAVDRATAAGVLVVVSAGNNGSFHGVLSPSTARTAISVGSVDSGDRLQGTSSKGPAPRTAAIKPDVLAPGEGFSTALNHQYGGFGATSMAAPIVAGVAALIKAVHRDWTPAQIKSAIINSAAAVSGEVMARGSGRVDAVRAVGSTVLLDPSSLSLALDPVLQATWSPTATIHLTNRGSQSVTYNVTAPPVAGVVPTAPASVTIASGATADLPVSFVVTNSAVSATTDSFSFGSDLTLTSTAMPPEVLRVPWAAVKAARGTVTYDKAFPDTVWMNRMSTTSPYQFKGIRTDEFSSEVLLRAPGTYDVMMLWADFDPAYPPQSELGKFSRLREADLFWVPSQNLNGDTTVNLLSSQASHTITLDGRDEVGQPLGQSGFNYMSSGRIIFPPTPPCTNLCLIVKSVTLPPFGTHLWKFNDINERVLLQEFDYNEQRQSFYAVTDGVLNGVRTDATMTGGGTTLKKANLGLYQFPGTNRDLVVTALPYTLSADNGLTLLMQSWGFTERSASDLFNFNLLIGPDADPAYSMLFTLNSGRNHGTDSSYATPYIRIVNNRIVATVPPAPNYSALGFLPAGTTFKYDGDALVFGNSMMVPVQTFVGGADGAFKPSLYTDFIGVAGEVRIPDRATTTTTLFAADGSVKASAATYGVALDMSQRGPYTIQAVDNTSIVAGVPRKATVTMNVDSTRADYFGPTFTSINLLNSDGKMATEIRDHTAASLTFSAADYAYSGTPPPVVFPSRSVPSNVTRVYQQIKPEATKVWYRYAPSTEWQTLTATQVAEDVGTAGDLFAYGAGILYRVDLTSVTNVDHANVDMKFDIADAAGNTTTYTMEPAFQVVHIVPTGRRPGRR